MYEQVQLLLWSESKCEEGIGGHQLSIINGNIALPVLANIVQDNKGRTILQGAADVCRSSQPSRNKGSPEINSECDYITQF